MKNKCTLILSPLLLFILYVTLTSYSTGITGQSVAGCTCHNPTASPNTVVTLTGLPSGGYVNGTVYAITVSVTNTVITAAAGGFGLRDGFDLTSTGGSFTAITGTTLNGATEIRHNTPKASVGGNASWTFNWTAPASGNTNISFTVAGNATNGDDVPGAPDSWNQASATIFKAGGLAVTASATAITCNGGLSTITVAGSGPTPPYQYQLNTGSFQSATTFSASAGTYTMTVKDASSITATTLLTISQPTLISVSASNTPILCNGGTSTITASASGGTGALTYRLNAGTFQSSAIFTLNLAATYTVTARDANLCTRSAILVVTQPTVMAFNAPTLTSPLCNGGNGSAAITASGGTGTKTYTIIPLGPQSNITGSFTGLSAQAYTVTVTDANNCTKTSVLTLTQPTILGFTAPTLNNPLCNGGTGSASISATGGTGTKTYTIAPLGPQSNTTGIFSGLTAQTYTVTVTDANNCTKTSAITLTQPTLLSFTTPTLNNPLCNGGTGSATITATGGTGTKTYSITPLGPQSNITGNFSGLTAQSYTVTVTDAGNCSKTSVITIEQPGSILLSSTVSNALCNGGIGSASVTATGGTGTMTYTINPLGPQSNVTGNFAGLTAQTYTVSVSDANNCGATTTLAVSEPNSIAFSNMVINNPLCNGGTGSASFSSGGGTGALTFSIAPLGPQSNTTGNFSGLSAQTYTITAIDANACSNTTTITLTEPAPLTVTASNVSGCSGSPVNLIGSPQGGIYSVANPYTGASTTYTYTYTDGNGCTATSAPASIDIINCSNTLIVKLFLESYYIGNSTMSPVLYNQGIGNSNTLTDSITVELHDANAPYGIVESKVLALNTDGTAMGTFDSNGSYYIAVKHRNTIQTWSAQPVSLSTFTFYDFSTSVFSAYGYNMIEIDPGVCAFYSGDITADENIDLLDLAMLETDINNFEYGYFATDLNGDGNVDLLDTPVLENNVSNFIFSNHP